MVNKKTMVLSMVLCLAGVLRAEEPTEAKEKESKQEFTFENETDKPCVAKFYYDGAEEFAQYAGFPIKPKDESTIELTEFWWFEKKGLGLARKGEKSGVVDVLMHHAANRLKIVILGVGDRDFNISGAQVVQDSYKIKIVYDKSRNIEIRLEKD